MTEVWLNLIEIVLLALIAWRHPARPRRPGRTPPAPAPGPGTAAASAAPPAVCLAITFRTPDGRRDAFHPHPDCPRHNTTKTREQLIAERQQAGRPVKYSTNNHVLLDREVSG